jgi:hypothetical protein
MKLASFRHVQNGYVDSTRWLVEGHALLNTKLEKRMYKRLQ